MLEITFHSLRHTHASQLIDAGVDVVSPCRLHNPLILFDDQEG